MKGCTDYYDKEAREKHQELFVLPGTSKTYDYPQDGDIPTNDDLEGIAVTLSRAIKGPVS